MDGAIRLRGRWVLGRPWRGGGGRGAATSSAAVSGSGVAALFPAHHSSGSSGGGRRQQRRTSARPALAEERRASPRPACKSAVIRRVLTYVGVWRADVRLRPALQSGWEPGRPPPRPAAPRPSRPGNGSSPVLDKMPGAGVGGVRTDLFLGAG